MQVEAGQSPLSLGAFTSYRCSGEVRPRKRRQQSVYGLGSPDGREGRAGILFRVPAG